MTRRGLVLPLVVLLFVSATGVRRSHLQLQSNVAATFPLMKRFGAITVDVYPHGFRASSIWLRAFAVNERKTITIENPISRMYDEMPMSEVGNMVRMVGGHPMNVGPPQQVVIAEGKVRGLPSHRYRLVYGANDFIDVWTTAALGPAPAFRAFIDAFVRAIAPASAAVLRKVPDTPIYVEVNMGQYRKLAIVSPRSIGYNVSGEAEALRVSPWMFRAPFGAIFK